MSTFENPSRFIHDSQCPAKGLRRDSGTHTDPGPHWSTARRPTQVDHQLNKYLLFRKMSFAIKEHSLSSSSDFISIQYLLSSSNTS